MTSYPRRIEVKNQYEGYTIQFVAWSSIDETDILRAIATIDSSQPSDVSEAETGRKLDPETLEVSSL